MYKLKNHVQQISASIALLIATAVPAAAQTSIEVWVRTAGSYGTGSVEPAKTAPKTVPIDKLPQKQLQRSDVQYGKTAYYRGVLLRDVIAQYNPPANVDLLLLRFRNGMVVPLPLRDEAWLKRLRPFVALGSAPTDLYHGAPDRRRPRAH